jgi:L-arabinose isomerase
MIDVQAPVVGVVPTMLDLYRQNIPEMPGRFAEHWKRVMSRILGDSAKLHFTDVAHTAEQFSNGVGECESRHCDLLVVLPMSYAPSGAAAAALTRTKLPLLILDTTWDASLPYEMDGDVLLANHAMHGVMDLTNALWRAGRRYHIIAGHPSEDRFPQRLRCGVRVAAAARVLQAGRIGCIGQPFEGMLDFTYDAQNLSDALGMQVLDCGAAEFVDRAGSVPEDSIAECVQWCRGIFDVDPDLTEQELRSSATYAVAIEQLTAEEQLAGVGFSFLSAVEAGAVSLPFLGADKLMAGGIGYAGEGDVLCAGLMAAVQRITCEATFTEWFCPDYRRNEILLSHMGECNHAMARTDRPVRLCAREFKWGNCGRLAVPVFQLRPGPVTVVCITETPPDLNGEKSFKLIATTGSILDAPEHPNLTNPHSRISVGPDLRAFLEAYSRAGGTHHVVLAYGDLRDDLQTLANYCRISFETVL